jgi:hypothetical protein
MSQVGDCRQISERTYEFPQQVIAYKVSETEARASNFLKINTLPNNDLGDSTDLDDLLSISGNVQTFFLLATRQLMADKGFVERTELEDLYDLYFKNDCENLNDYEEAKQNFIYYFTNYNLSATITARQSYIKISPEQLRKLQLVHKEFDRAYRRFRWLLETELGRKVLTKIFSPFIQTDDGQIHVVIDPEMYANKASDSELRGARFRRELMQPCLKYLLWLIEARRKY